MPQGGPQPKLSEVHQTGGIDITPRSEPEMRMAETQPHQTPSAAPFFQTFSAWDELRNLADELPFPAWLEDERAGVFFINRSEGSRVRLDARAVQDIRLRLAEGVEAGAVSVRDERGQWHELSVCTHLIPVVPDDPTFGSVVELTIACVLGEEQARDHSLISALLGRMVGNSVSSTLATLTPQQRIIYRLLISNHTYKEIAAHLGVAHATIRVQIAAMRKRLGPTMIPLLRRDTAC